MGNGEKSQLIQGTNGIVSAMTPNDPSPAESLIRPELDKLLKMAEALQETCDRLSSRRSFHYGVIFGMLLVTGAACAFAYMKYQVRDNSDNTFSVFIGAMVAVYGVFMGLLARTQASRTDRALYRDRKALFAIVDMLREIEPTVAAKENFTTLEQAEFRIRLARFDVGSSR